MTRAHDSHGAAADLPSFLGEDRPERAGTTGSPRAAAELQVAEDDLVEQREPAASYEHREQGGPYSEETFADDALYRDDVRDDRAPGRWPTAAPGATRAGGFAEILVGAVTGLLGAAQWIAPAATPFLRDAGWTAPSLLTVGAVAVSLGFARRRIGQLHQRLEQTEHARSCRDDDLEQRLDLLLDRAAATADPAANDQQVERLLLALQRQDQKINNLTKATKMYGKPLMEVATQTNDIAAALERSAAEAGGGATDFAAASSRIDDVADATVAVRRQLGEVLEQLRGGAEQQRREDELRAQLAEASDMESCVRDIRREVTGLAASLVKVHEALARGGDAPARAGHRTEAPPVPAAPTEPADYATGERKSGGQNVLGAIAKLKQLKG